MDLKKRILLRRLRKGLKGYDEGKDATTGTQNTGAGGTTNTGGQLGKIRNVGKSAFNAAKNTIGDYSKQQTADTQFSKNLNYTGTGADAVKNFDAKNEFPDVVITPTNKTTENNTFPAPPTPDTPSNPVEQPQIPASPTDALKNIPNVTKGGSKLKGVGKKLLGNAQQIITSGIGTYGAIANAFGPTKGVNELISDAGTSQGVAMGGYEFQKQNDIDSAKERQELSQESTQNTLNAAVNGASLGGSIGMALGPIGGGVGAVLGGLGGAIAGLFGAGSRKRKLERKMRLATMQVNRTNTAARSGANTDYLQSQELLNYGNTQNGMLYSAKEGKDENNMIDISRYMPTLNVNTSLGKINAQPNAKVAGGESIIDGINDPSETTGYIVKEGKRGVDGPLANLNEDTIVLGGDRDWRTGQKFMDMAAPYTAALEHINKKFEKRTNKTLNNLRGSMGQYTDKINQQEINKIKTPIVEKLKDFADQQKYQHELGYQFEGMAKRGKDLPGYWRGMPYLPEDDSFKLGQWNWSVNDGSQFLAQNKAKMFPKSLSAAMDTTRVNGWLPKITNIDDVIKTPKTILPTDKELADFQKKASPIVKKQLQDMQNSSGIEKISPWGNLFAGITGMGMSLGQYFDAKNQDIHTPDIYASNKNARHALNTLAGLNINPYGIMRQIYDKSLAARFNTNRAGGLSGGQRYLANVANYLGTNDTIAKMLTDIQVQNNTYKSKYGELDATLGYQDATARQAANQYNMEYAAKAHAAKLAGEQAGLSNFLAQLQQYYANDYKRRVHNGMLSLYQQDINNNRLRA